MEVTANVLRGEPAKLASLYGSGDGYGYGSGDGYGNGSGDGSGYGDGYGYGSGYGYGYGDGSGSGYGDGYGYGSGYGDGYGDGSGSGYGDGYGYGSGDGSGYGNGSGYGSGYGDGYGSGSGSGSGDGYGYGDGYGAGSGDGYGSGSGDGNGSGSGSKDYWLATIPRFAAKWSDGQRARFNAAQEAGLQIAFWRSDESGLPSNGGGKIEPSAPGVVHTAPGPLNLCHRNTLHATLLPTKWKGERWWIVALHGEVVGDEEKYGCLKREIIGEAL